MADKGKLKILSKAGSYIAGGAKTVFGVPINGIKGVSNWLGLQADKSSFMKKLVEMARKLVEGLQESVKKMASQINKNTEEVSQNAEKASAQLKKQMENQKKDFLDIGKDNGTRGKDMIIRDTALTEKETFLGTKKENILEEKKDKKEILNVKEIEKPVSQTEKGLERAAGKEAEDKSLAAGFRRMAEESKGRAAEINAISAQAKREGRSFAGKTKDVVEKGKDAVLPGGPAKTAVKAAVKGMQRMSPQDLDKKILDARKAISVENAAQPQKDVVKKLAENTR